MIPLPQTYSWLNDETGPRILTEALSLYGTKEISGGETNPVIISWAKEIGGWISDFYKEDEIPWCGLFIAVAAKRAGYPFSQKALSAREWENWGAAVQGNSPMLGDVMIFTRKNGGHVGLYVGEDHECYHILGGNQSDEVNISRLSKDRFLVCKRSPFKIGQPDNVRKVFLSPSGKISDNEA